MEGCIVGVDPGTVRLGYGVLAGSSHRPSLLDAGTLKVPASWSVAKRLAGLQVLLRRVLEGHPVQCVALESSFQGKNAEALVRLAEARGMVIGLAGMLQLAVFDYTPAMVKKAVTGKGNASKVAVARMVHGMLPAPPELGLDATDALAVALTHARRLRFQELTRSWPGV